MPATEAQLRFATSLFAERDITGLPQKWQDRIRTICTGGAEIEKDAASKLIETLLAQPKIATPEIPDGRYAVYNDDQSVNDIGFYKIENGTGKWDGYTFVKQIVGGHEPQPVPRTQRNKVLAKIADMGPEASLRLYGIKTEHCGVCGRELTNQDSREYGMGPDCRAKYGR